MANPHVGEVAFRAGDEEYTLSFSANAMCELEVALDMDVDTLIDKFKSGNGFRLDTLRVMFWQGLRDHHENITLDDTKRLLKQLRGSEMGELLGRAFVLGMPQAKEKDSVSSPPQPDEPQGGTGPASSTNGATPTDPKPSSGG